MPLSVAEAAFTIAHEIAHSRLQHSAAGYDAEGEADALALHWGFTEPADRPAERERARGT